MKYVECPKNFEFDLIRYSKDNYSQNGEDGILEKMFDLLEIANGYACEFGAWDGKLYSNTFNLVKNHDWNCIMIECDQEKFNDLKKTAEENPGITPINASVHYSKEKGEILDEILERTKLPKDFDLLSIDVDSCDYHIWKSLTSYYPKVVVIEHSGIDDFIVQREGAVHKIDIDGSTSFWPMKELGESKGYRLICNTGNLIFLKEELFESISSKINLN